MSPSVTARVLHALSTVALMLLTACGSSQSERRPSWSAGEQLRWARLNPCPCLASDQLITSVELRPLDLEEPTRLPPELGPWERVALKRPLSPEAEALLKALQSSQAAPTMLLTEVNPREHVQLEGHILRVAQLIASPERPSEVPLEAPLEASPEPPPEPPSEPRAPTEEAPLKRP